MTQYYVIGKWWEFALAIFVIAVVTWVVTMRYKPAMEFEDRCQPEETEVRHCAPPGIDYG